MATVFNFEPTFSKFSNRIYLGTKVSKKISPLGFGHKSVTKEAC